MLAPSMTSTMANLAASSYKSGNAAAIAPLPGQQPRTSMAMGKDDAMPRAIYVRLSDEMLRQLKSSNAMGPLALELDMGATAPTSSSSATLPKSSQAGSVRKPTPTSINVGNKRFQLQPHLLDTASSGSSGSSARDDDISTTLFECDATPTSRNAALPLQSIASSSGRHFVVAEATQSAEAPVKERTAANMGERIRERAQQLEKEKRSRKIVLVDDEGPIGSKGKKKTGKSGAGSRVANPLIKSNSARSGSPAVVSARASPSLGPTTLVGSSRPPNRLVASEAAKDLLKKQQNEQKAQSAAEAKPSATSATLAIQESAVQSEDDKHEMKGKAIGEHPKTNSASTTRETKNASFDVAQPQYHQSKVDMDDLASASSSDDDDSDADRLPLAVRTASPVKSSFVEGVQGGAVSTGGSAPVVQSRVQSVTARPIAKQSSSRDSLSSSGSSDASASPGSAATKLGQRSKITGIAASQVKGADTSSTKSKSLHTPPSPQPQDIPQLPQVRSKSPAGRSSPGGPRAVAKTSGGSRLSKPVPKRSPRTSPGPAAAVQSTSPPRPDTAQAENPTVIATSSAAPSQNLGSTSNIPTTSISRPHSPEDPPPPAHNIADKSSSSESTLAVALQPSRTPSPSSRSPSHPLPPKPPPSPGYARPGAAPRSVSRQSTPSLPSASAVQAGVSSITNGSSATQGDRLRPVGISLPPSLPANPITGVTPSIPRSPVSSAPVSRQPSVSASSPIVSTFSKSREAATGSPRSTKTFAATDLEGRHQVNAKRKERLEGAEDKNRSRDHRKRQKLATSESEEEGEYQPSSDSRARQESTTRSETATAGKQHSSVPDPVDGNVAAARDERVKISSGLPSFTKKGRMSELMPSGRRESRPTSQAGSRANTPISYAVDTDEESSQGGKAYLTQPRDSHRRGGSVHITTDNDFIRYSQEFEKRLFPEYSRLYRDLEDLKSSLSSSSGRDRGKSRPEYTVQKVARLVEDVNERAAELERIKHALEVYNNRKAVHGDTQPIVVYPASSGQLAH